MILTSEAAASFALSEMLAEHKKVLGGCFLSRY